MFEMRKHASACGTRLSYLQALAPTPLAQCVKQLPRQTTRTTTCFRLQTWRAMASCQGTLHVASARADAYSDTGLRPTGRRSRCDGRISIRRICIFHLCTRSSQTDMKLTQLRYKTTVVSECAPNGIPQHLLPKMLALRAIAATKRSCKLADMAVPSLPRAGTIKGTIG